MESLIEPVTENGKPEFCVEMMKRLDIQRRNEHLCDVILEVGSGDDQARLKAHKIVLSAASPFFYNALNSEMKEKEEGVIRLQETSQAVLEEVLKYVYTGHVDIHEVNAFDLLQISDFLVIPSLKDASSKFISGTLSSSNCIVAYYSAVRYQCPELQQQASDFILADFMDVTQSQDFLNLNIEQVEECISSDRITVKGEEEVFQVIVKWMERNEHGERERFFELFRHLRIVYLSRNHVFNVILPHPLVKNSETCTSFVLDAMKEVSYGTEECYLAQPPRSCLNTYEDGLVACGKNKTFCYLPSENKWYEMADMLSEISFPAAMSACHGKLYMSGTNVNDENCTMERYYPTGNSWAAINSYTGVVDWKFPGAIVNFQGFLYVIGAVNESKVSSTVQKYNPDTNVWQEVAPLGMFRSGVCAVADRSSLYAIGGQSGSGPMDVVERFDPEKNSWSRLASTLEKRSFSCGTIVRGKVFVFGGIIIIPGSHRFTSAIEMYDPASNVWTGIESMAAPKCSFGAASFKGKIFVVGSENSDSFMHVYDVDENEWKPCAGVPQHSFLVTLAPLRIPRDILDTCRVVS